MSILNNLLDYKYELLYYDILMKNSAYTKQSILDELGISAMTFKRSLEKKYKNYNAIINIFRKYYNINKEDCIIEQELIYECENSIIAYTFMKHYDNKLIKDNININSFLKPYYLLLYCFVEYINPNIYKLDSYSSMYIFEPFKSMYNYLLLKHNSKLFNSINIYLDLISPFKELAIEEIAMQEYANKNYSASLFYLEQALPYFISNLNVNHILGILEMKISSLIHIKNFTKAIIDIKPILNYLRCFNHELHDNIIYLYNICLLGSKYFALYKDENSRYKYNSINKVYLDYIYLVLNNNNEDFNYYDDIILVIRDSFERKNFKPNIELEDHLNILVNYLIKHN